MISLMGMGGESTPVIDGREGQAVEAWEGHDGSSIGIVSSSSSSRSRGRSNRGPLSSSSPETSTVKALITGDVSDWCTPKASGKGGETCRHNEFVDAIASILVDTTEADITVEKICSRDSTRCSRDPESTSCHGNSSSTVPIDTDASAPAHAPRSLPRPTLRGFFSSATWVTFTLPSGDCDDLEEFLVAGGRSVEVARQAGIELVEVAPSNSEATTCPSVDNLVVKYEAKCPEKFTCRLKTEPDGVVPRCHFSIPGLVVEDMWLVYGFVMLVVLAAIVTILRRRAVRGRRQHGKERETPLEQALIARQDSQTDSDRQLFATDVQLTTAEGVTGDKAAGTVMDSLNFALAKHEEREREEARYNRGGADSGHVPEGSESNLTHVCHEIKLSLLCAASGGSREPPDEDVD